MRFLDFKRKYLKASMSLEAAIAVPVFIFAILTILSVMEIFRANADIEKSLHSSARELALYSYAADKLENAVSINGITEDFLDTVAGDGYAYYRLTKDYTGENGQSTAVTEGGISAISLGESYADNGEGIIDLSFMYKAGPIYNFFGNNSQLFVNRMRFHTWTGYGGGEESDEDGERIVYVTEYGEVYHLSRSCSYLDLNIRAVEASELENLRNASGGIYYACESCNPTGEGTVYITDYGEAYHSSLTCSGLKRTIYELPLSEVGDKHVCSGCMQ